MKLIASILFGLLVIVPFEYSATNENVSQLPTDVAKFKERRDLCDHFRGEEPYDEERRTFLMENLEKYCTGTDNELALLKAKYKNYQDVMRVLGEYEERIESGSF